MATVHDDLLAARGLPGSQSVQLVCQVAVQPKRDFPVQSAQEDAILVCTALPGMETCALRLHMSRTISVE